MNIVFSVFLTMLSCLVFFAKPLHESALYIIIFCFMVWIMSGGFILSAFYYEFSRKNDYYFYYNLGMSKVKLMMNAYLLNFLIFIPVIILLKYV